MGRTTVRVISAGALALVALGGAALLTPHAARAQGEAIGINVLLGCDPTDAVLTDLGRFGAVLDVMPEIRAATLRADEAALESIQALPYVAAATPDREVEFAAVDTLPVPDLSAGADCWNLDAVNVTDFGAGRTVAYDGAGVYVAVIDTGLPHNWRTYFPEERIATQFARAFTGGGGQAAVVSSQPEKWEESTEGHGAIITGIVLGFAYAGTDPAMPRYLNGVAPKATVIPVRFHDKDRNSHFTSIAAHAILYVADLKASGALGSAPVVINASWGISAPDALLRSAIDYAISRGVLFVAGAGNSAGAGMLWPAAYPEVISVAATGIRAQFPDDDPTTVRWLLRDVPEADPSVHYVGPFSSRELPGQELDVAAPGSFVPAPWRANGQANYSFHVGTSEACPHVTGIAALMLQKNPGLSQGAVESILATTAMPLPPGSATVHWASIGPGNEPTWDDHGNVSFFELSTSWGADATGHGLVQADAALAATPNP